MKKSMTLWLAAGLMLGSLTLNGCQPASESELPESSPTPSVSAEAVTDDTSAEYEYVLSSFDTGVFRNYLESRNEDVRLGRYLGSGTITSGESFSILAPDMEGTSYDVHILCEKDDQEPYQVNYLREGEVIGSALTGDFCSTKVIVRASIATDQRQGADAITVTTQADTKFLVVVYEINRIVHVT